MGDNNALLIKGSVFVKFQKSCIIKKTQQGSIYMNSLQQFRKLYKDSGDETIGDPYEGKLYIYNADCFIPDKGYNEHLSNYALQTKNENDFVYCLFNINIDKYNFFQFGNEIKDKLPKEYDKALIITNPEEFFKRLIKKAKDDGIELHHGCVNYYDEEDDLQRLYSLLSNGTKNVAFHKRKQYAYQQEYRFVSPNPEKLDHIELKIGDISGISYAIETKKLLCSTCFREK